jgi:isocitrate/isopropylmalate dehydrogenase
MMLEWLGHAEAATEIRSGVCTVLAQHATPDAGGSLNTSEFTAAVIAQVV